MYNSRFMCAPGTLTLNVRFRVCHLARYGVQEGIRHPSKRAFMLCYHGYWWFTVPWRGGK
jgi:hypothetical protein